jgi:hypothetical protein
METATWVNCRADFAVDGPLVNLICPGTGSDEWETFWAALRSGPFGLRAYRDGEPIPLPETASWALAERKVASVMVSVLAGTVTANCHFFGGDLELDIDPREVVSEEAFESVLAVMRLVAAAIGMPVFATPEAGGTQHAFLRVSPVGQAIFLWREGQDDLSARQ